MLRHISPRCCHDKYDSAFKKCTFSFSSPGRATAPADDRIALPPSALPNSPPPVHSRHPRQSIIVRPDRIHYPRSNHDPVSKRTRHGALAAHTQLGRIAWKTPWGDRMGIPFLAHRILQVWRWHGRRSFGAWHGRAWQGMQAEYKLPKNAFLPVCLCNRSANHGLQCGRHGITGRQNCRI